MMTMDDAFDAKLKAAFESADTQILASQEFVEHLVRRLGRSNRQRWMILGSAASVGSIIAASQLERLAGQFSVEPGLFSQIFTILSPESMVSIVLATIMAAFGLLLPATSR